MPKFELKITEREGEWSKHNEPLQSVAITQSAAPDTPGTQEGVTQSAGAQAQSQSKIHTQSGGDTPGYGQQDGPLSPLSD